MAGILSLDLGGETDRVVEREASAGEGAVVSVSVACHCKVEGGCLTSSLGF